MNEPSRAVKTPPDQKSLILPAAKKIRLAVRSLEFQSRLCHFLAVRPQHIVKHLNICFIVYKMTAIIIQMRKWI